MANKKCKKNEYNRDRRLKGLSSSGIFEGESYLYSEVFPTNYTQV